MGIMSKTATIFDYPALHAAMTDRLVGLGHSLSPQQWQSPSLCEGWRVCDVFGHITYGGVTPLRKIGPILLFKYRGNLNRGSAVESVRYANANAQALVVAEFERARHHPVGIGKLIKTDELHMDHIVHELDIRRPLDLATEWQPDDLRAALDTSVRTKNPLISPARTAQGLRFVTTDIEWSHGPSDAPRVEGPAEDMLLAICGRTSALTALHGNGVAELSARISR
jgi:uncharacterized protein (TIGR03083 family)